MSVFRRTHPLLGLRAAHATLPQCIERSSSNSSHIPTVEVPVTSSAPTPQPSFVSVPSTLSSGTQLWEYAVHAFYSMYSRYTRKTAHMQDVTHVAVLAMRRCLAEHHATEALEVYETLCQCGVVSMTALSVPASRSAALNDADSLDRLARTALQHVPHRKCQHTMLSLLMAAEMDDDTLANSLFYPVEETDAEDKTTEQCHTSSAHNTKRSSTLMKVPLSPLFTQPKDVSVAEQARIRVHQHLHTLQATGQLQQPLGKEYCLVEMQELCGGPGAATSFASTKTSSSSSTSERAQQQLRNEIEVGPLCALSKSLLEHPFAYMTPSAPWAQRELLWEADMRVNSWWDGTRVTLQTGTLTPADARRLGHIDHMVRPYRSLCKNTLTFLTTSVPHWDELLVRRVAETLVLPPQAHVAFPPSHHRFRSAAAVANCRGSRNGLFSHRGGAEVAYPVIVTTWTDESMHQLFGVDERTNRSNDCNRSNGYESDLRCLSSGPTISRVQDIIKRRVHHHVVVPDAAYTLHHFHQLRQLSRHREVIVTHAVFLELVSVAARTDSPLRFQARRVLQDVMNATTTAVTAAAWKESELILRREHAGRNSSGGSTSISKNQRATCGFTLLGLQDELALLENCPERFFLQEHVEANEAGGKINLSKNSTSSGAASCVSVVLVAKQLERVIAAHDRGDDFAKTLTTNMSSSVSPTQFDIGSLLCHLLEGNDGEVVATQAARIGTKNRTESIFKSRSRGHWARLQVLVATTSDVTRAAAFQIGLSMYPPASAAP